MLNNTATRSMLALCVSIASLPLSTGVFAQRDLSQYEGLEEVIVTARKREQGLQDVSVAVSALTGQDIANAQIRNSEDLSYLIPSLNLQRGGNARNSSFNIRGIGTQSFSTAVEPSVSTMVDGVVMGRSAQAFMQLLDVERVEVLRGPQGTLFGKNSTGGVVHIITRNPTEVFSGEVSGTVVEDDEYRAGLTVSGPVTDRLGYRFSANVSDVDGFTRNVFDGNDLNGGDDWTVRGKLRWLPTDLLELKWASDYGDRDCDCTAQPIRSLELFPDNPDPTQNAIDNIAPVVAGDENDEVNINKKPYSDSESWGHSLEANWDIGEFTVTSITAYREFEITSFIDVDNQPTDVFGANQIGTTEQDQFTQEIRLASPAAERLDYVVGLYYFNQNLDRQFERGFEIVPGSPGTGIATFDAKITNWALFGEANYALSDRWRFILGARYTEDEIEFNFARTREGTPLGVPDPVDPTPGDTDDDDLSGKVGLEWDMTDAAMAYLTYTEGYKGPAFDLNFGTDPVDLERVEPETSESWELGAKGNFLDNRLQLSVALFHSEYDEFQAQAFLDPDGIPDCPDDNPNCDPNDDPGAFVLINAGQVSTEGIEVDFVALPLPQLRLSGGFAIIDAKIDDYPAGICSGGQKFRQEEQCLPIPPALQDLSGGDLPFSPDWKFSLQAAYTIEFDWGVDLILKPALRAQDDVQYGLHQDPNTVQDGYTIYDFSATLQDQQDRWDVTLFVKNLTDEFFVSNIMPANENILPNGYSHILPRTYERRIGLEARYRW